MANSVHPDRTDPSDWDLCAVSQKHMYEMQMLCLC